MEYRCISADDGCERDSGKNSYKGHAKKTVQLSGARKLAGADR